MVRGGADASARRPCYGKCQMRRKLYFMDDFWVKVFCFCFRSVSSSRLERSFRWPTCYPHVSWTVPDDLYVVEEERAHPIYQTGSGQLTQGTVGRAPFQNHVLVFSLKAVFSFSKSFFLFQHRCNWAAVMRPVSRRQRSMARRRPMATAAFLRPPPALLFSRCRFHFWTGG